MAPDQIEAGVAELRDIPELDILDAPYQQEDESQWIMKIRLRPTALVDSDEIAEETDWYVRIDNTYPGGNIKIYPAKENGITHTYPHQMLNTPGSADRPWRSGNICVDRYEHTVGRTGGYHEPFDATERLRWYILRAIDWLERASRGELRRDGEPFELPAVSRPSSHQQFAYNETRASFHYWSDHFGTYGCALISQPETTDVQVAVEYCDLDGNTVYTPDWGDTIQTDRGIPAVWWLLDEPPIKPPWEVPENWLELKDLLDGTEDNIFDVLSNTREAYPDATFSFLLLGFPIPERIGEDDAYIHWQGIKIDDIPRLSNFQGLRDLPANQDRLTRLAFRDDAITWLESDNWAQDQLLRRGNLAEPLRDSRIMVVGAGALGSTVAESLLRDGCTQLTIVDGEMFEIGNLARHTLSLKAVNHRKAAAVADRLRNLSPHAVVHTAPSRYPLSDADQEEIPEPDIILDCTGNEQVLYALDQEHWESPKLVVSTSLSPQGQRLYTYAAFTHTFDRSDFAERMEPWALHDLTEHRPDEDIVPERVGCWHPASVIRMSTIAMWGGIVPELLEESTALGIGEVSFTVLEQSRQRGAVSVDQCDAPFPDSITWLSRDGKSLELPRRCLIEMIDYFESDAPDETGGILTGRYMDETHGRIIRVSDPPPDSVQTPAAFLRGTEQVDEALQESQERHGLYYVGEWHTHPDEPPRLSGQDKREMQSIADNDEYECPTPFLIIIGGNRDTGFEIQPYLFYRGKGYDTLTPAKEPCTDDLTIDATSDTVIYRPGNRDS